MRMRQVKIWYWIIDRLPIKLVYFCALKVVAHSTSGKYGRTIVPELSAMDAIGRYSKDKLGFT